MIFFKECKVDSWGFVSVLFIVYFVDVYVYFSFFQFGINDGDDSCI